ncbi:low molecular weight phosphatase family protein [Microbacterium sp. NPDC006705]|uniref:arsenate-mycothiol transferase ArsC n=1 Tax=Micrococcales TaxID=85006 RepID=UPI0037B02BBF
MSRDHRPPIRNPFLPPTPEEPEVPDRDGGHPAGDGGDVGAPAASTAREDRLAEFRLGSAFRPHPADPAAPRQRATPAERTVAPAAAEPAAPASPATSAPGVLPSARVLVVCTGNICRSAYVEYALQAQLNALLGDRGRAEVTSAGTEPNQALTVPGPLLDLAPSRRVRAALTQHRPQQLTGRSLAGQDLVLTATDDHLDEVLREDPAAVRRTFTILGIGTLLRDHGEELAAAVPPGAGVTALVTALAELRSRLIAHGERPDADLPDPFRGPAEGYAAMAQTAQPIVELLAWEIARALDGDLVEDEEPTGA